MMEGSKVTVEMLKRLLFFPFIFVFVVMMAEEFECMEYGEGYLGGGLG